MILAVVGAGGKTSLIKRYAKKYLAQGLKVFVTTSTHMFVESDTLLTDDADAIIRELEQKHYVMAGIPAMPEESCINAHLDINAMEKEKNLLNRADWKLWSGGKMQLAVDMRRDERNGGKLKMKSLPITTYYKVCEHADVVLIEADGSKHKPIKFPNEHEPVIYDNVDEILVVCGLHALGQPVKMAAHRLDLVKQCLGIGDDVRIEATHIQKLVMKGYVEPMREKYPNKTIKIEANHDGSLYQRALASLLASELDVSLLKEEWFLTQPKLIVCGAGHVSSALVQIASCLDFYIKVIDDREEFANKERFPMADEVICDSFEHLENYLEPNAYYAVLSRGHKDDYECVKTILQQEYQYLGMIGSKLKVQKTFEKLAAAGATAEQIERIHAPIGLKIKAATPAEIAVSILAEMILVKNSRQTSYASRELLQVKEHGMLCVIIEKKGSSPRGVGSMMFVGKEGIVDSIGGGPVEYAVIREVQRIWECAKAGIGEDSEGQRDEAVGEQVDVRKIEGVSEIRAFVREYHLNNEESQKLGMICGGSNKILFLPI